MAISVYLLVEYYIHSKTKHLLHNWDMLLGAPSIFYITISHFGFWLVKNRNKSNLVVTYNYKRLTKDSCTSYIKSEW